MSGGCLDGEIAGGSLRRPPSGHLVASSIHPFIPRIALAAASLTGALLMAEAGLRCTTPTLPSLAALHDRPDLLEPFLVEPGQRRRDERRCDQTVRDPRGRDVTFGSTEPIRTLWFAGDSMTAGMGVGSGEAWPDRLAQQLQARIRGTVVVRNLALPGVGYCEVLRRVHSELQFGHPDVVLIGLFADDLEARAMLATDGGLVGLPHTIASDTLRWWARRSYAINLAWFASTSRPSGPVRFIDGPGRRAFQTHMVAVTDRVRAAGAEPLVVLLEPVGAADCSASMPADPTHRCSWMPDDLALMATLLDEVGVETVDTRGLWHAVGAAAIESERGRGLAIHPDADGHAALAQHLVDRLGPKLADHSHAGARGDLANR